MSLHSPFAQDIPHSPPDGRFALGPTEKAAVIRARLSEIARRDSTSIAAVLEYWLKPEAVDEAIDR